MKEITMHMKVEVVHHEDGFTALCPQLPGCVTEGATEEEARLNPLDAIQVYLETVEETGNYGN